jgi:hypothetical protein
MIPCDRKIGMIGDKHGVGLLMNHYTEDRFILLISPNSARLQMMAII